MALPDLTGQFIQDTYQRVLQVSGSGVIVDGTGSLFTPTSLTIDNTIIVPNPGTGTTSSIAVTVVDDGANRFVLNGVKTGSLNLNSGDSYKFDQSNGTNDGHPIAFKLASDESTPYTTNVTTVGTAGDAGSYVQISITDDTPNLIYYCTTHGNDMGGGAVLTILKGSTTVAGLLEVTGSTKLQGDLSSTGTISASKFTVSASSDAQPGYTFWNNPTTGMLSNGPTNLKFQVNGGGSPEIELTTAQSIFRVPIQMAGRELIGPSRIRSLGSITGSNFELPISGNLKVDGQVSASTYIGDGSGLTGIVSPNTGLSGGGVLTTIGINGVNYAVGAQSSSLGDTTIVGALSINGTSRTLFTSASMVYSGSNIIQVTQSYESGTQQITNILYSDSLADGNPLEISVTGSDGITKLYSMTYSGDNITQILVT